MITETAHAKVNLALHVRALRADGYHELESLFAFCADGDELRGAVREDGDVRLSIEGMFADDLSAGEDNLVVRAARALQDASGTGLGADLSLDKQLPIAAGIGGGSADAAAALRLLARLNGISLDDARLAAAALQVGADVPVCLASQARMMRGVGEQLSAPLALPPLTAVLVNPGVPLGTREVFARFSLKEGGARTDDGVPADFETLIGWLDRHGNDLTAAAITCAPVIADVLAALRAVPGARLARMSGSGATCFALFASPADAEAAARQLQAAHPGWWVAATQLR